MFFSTLASSPAPGAQNDHRRERPIAICPGCPRLSETQAGYFAHPSALPSFGAAVAGSQTLMGSLWHYPAEDEEWLEMQNKTAYFRDVMFGANTLIYGAEDGETWHAEFIEANGTMRVSPTLKFFRDFDGKSNCFVSPFWSVCGSDSASVLWYQNGQCRTTGLWKINFYKDSGFLFSTDFSVLPQIEEEKVPAFNQAAYADATKEDHHYDNVCRVKGCKGRDCSYTCDGRENETKVTIRTLGCYLTSCANILKYHGVDTDPVQLNSYLKGYADKDGNLIGFLGVGNVNPMAVVAYAREKGTEMSFMGRAFQKEDLETLLCAYGPQIIGVRNNGHFVTATGRAEDQSTWFINDPSGGEQTTLAKYNNEFSGIRAFSGPEKVYSDQTGLVILFHSPGELLLTGPDGTRLGRDPIRGVDYAEIPRGAYDTEGLDECETGDPGPPLMRELEIMQPAQGEYDLTVTGTDTGFYDLDLQMYDREGKASTQAFAQIPIAPGALHRYRFAFSSDPAARLAIDGGFDGKGQRPDDVNKTLTYISPGQAQTKLPALTMSYPLVICYSESLASFGFSAVLNGTDITAFFHPSPKAKELINIPLVAGRNVLILSAKANIGGRASTDTDRLVFLVE